MKALISTIRVVRTEKKPEGYLFVVRVEEDTSFSEHEVTLDAKLWQRFANVYDTPEQLVDASFRFLLQRERKRIHVDQI